MQTTVNIWEALCRDLESKKKVAQSDEYEEIANAFLEAAKRVLRPDSPRLCDAIEIAADVCQAAGRLDEAAENFAEALKKSREFGTVAASARLAAKLGLLHDRLGNTVEARASYELAVALYDERQDHSQHSMLFNQLGALCKSEGDLEGTEKYYLRAIEISTMLHGDTHPETATAANNLGVAYTETKDFVKAENLHMRALSIRENCYGAMHPEVAESMSNLAVVYHSTGDHEKAAAFYTGALNILKRFRPIDDPEMMSVQANYDLLLRRLENAA